jgi:predicted PurR-regulated permease PerM
MASSGSESPRWSTSTKTLVALTGLVLLGGLVLRFHAIIPLLVLAGIVAYLILPVVRGLNRRARLSWVLATNLCFLSLAFLLAAASTATGLAVVQQLQALFFTVQQFLVGLPALIESVSHQTILVGPVEIDLSLFDLGRLAEQALASVQPVLGQVSGLLRSLATVAVETLARLLFVLAVAYFLTMDYERLRSAWTGLALPGYEQDLHRLRGALGHIWDAFFRGQLLIVAATGVVTGLLMAALGVRFSLGLGVLGGLAKFVPIVGPALAGGVAALVALFQPTNWFGLSPLAYAGLVIVSVSVLNQLIDIVLLPRIMGTSLNLHPAIILIGAIIGASLAGVIGLLLSAPTVATLLLLGRYTYRKMVDLSPWDPPIDAVPAAHRSTPLWSGWVRRKEVKEKVEDADL